MIINATLTPADVKLARDAAQHALHQARAEAATSPRKDHWRGVADKLARVILKITQPHAGEARSAQ